MIHAFTKTTRAIRLNGCEDSHASSFALG